MNTTHTPRRNTAIKLLTMKTIVGFFLVFVMVASCTKNNHFDRNELQPLQPTPQVDTLSGREFNFSNLVWEAGYDDWLEGDKTFITISTRPDLFKTLRKIEVSFVFDSTTVWIYPRTLYQYSPHEMYYVYYTNTTSGSLRILSNNLYTDLIGKKSSVRVKFL